MYNANNMVEFGASNGPSHVQGSEKAYMLNVLEASSQINPPEKDQVRDTVFLQWQSPQLSSSSWAFIPLFFLSCQSPSPSEVQDPVEGINYSYLHLIPYGTEGGGILDPKIRVRRGWKKASQLSGLQTGYLKTRKNFCTKNMNLIPTYLLFLILKWCLNLC